MKVLLLTSLRLVFAAKTEDGRTTFYPMQPALLLAVAYLIVNGTAAF
jgi:hypothetical protein